MSRKTLIFITTDEGCFIPLSHKLNADGYFRKAWAWGLEMFHRTIWRLHRGDIPSGHEVDHLCKNRACCNIDHLQCIPGDTHASETNRSRYSQRKQAAKDFWLEYGPTGTDLAKEFKVDTSTACGWIREWVKTSD